MSYNLSLKACCRQSLERARSANHLSGPFWECDDCLSSLYRPVREWRYFDWQEQQNRGLLEDCERAARDREQAVPFLKEKHEHQ